MELIVYSDIQQTLADKIYYVRKKQHLTQKEVALKAGIPLSTYQRLEQEGEGSLKNFCKTLIVLNRADEIEKILNISSETPVEAYENQQRASQKDG